MTGWFYGKRGLGTTIFNLFKAFSPIELRAAARSRGLGAPMGVVRESLANAAPVWKQVRQHYTPTAPDIGGRYMMGQNLEDLAADFGIGQASGNTAMRRYIRTGAVGAAALYAGSSLLMGNDNPLANTIGFGTKAAFHTMAAYGIGHLSYPWAPYAGLGYLGLAGLNAMRSGDNLGPF